MSLNVSGASLKTRVELWLASRIGYGTLDAPFWFLGMEEACQAHEIPARLAGNVIEDLREAHARIGSQYDRLFRRPRAALQSTWRRLLRTLASAKCLPLRNDVLAEYQATRWGRENGETLLAELFPLPSPKTRDWHYAAMNVAGLTSRKLYYAKHERDRTNLFWGLYSTKSPRWVVAYGEEHWSRFKAVFRDRAEWEPFAFAPEWGVHSGNVALVWHPTRPGQADLLWDELGRWARQFK